MIKKTDHFVITTNDVPATVAFYKKLGFIAKDKENRFELHAGDFKINVHTLGKELTPHAENVQTGSADFCFEIDGNLQAVKNELEQKDVEIELGIVERNGAHGDMRSIYLRDPNGNLVELCSYE